MEDQIPILAFVFIFGACIGSFLNVCIHRIPKGISLLHPSSQCPTCRTPIRFYDNLPILSFLFLKRRCRSCNAMISYRYPLVEFLTGLLAVSIGIRYGISLEGFIFFLFAAALLTVTFIDIDHQMIPDRITLPGILGGLAAAAVLPEMRLIDSLLGILAGGGVLLAVALLYHAITRKEGMGGGDIKLLAMIGAMTGWTGVLFTVFIASVFGALVGAMIMLKTETGLKTAVPFGPFLSLGALAYVYTGPEWISWYLHLSR